MPKVRSKRARMEDENVNTISRLSGEDLKTPKFQTKTKKLRASPPAAPFKPRDAFTDQPLNRSLGESSSKARQARLASNPLPHLPWAQSSWLWSKLVRQDGDSTNLRDPGLFRRHPLIKPKMRSILLDWISEVCEVYKMHRETYYLAIDYLDRFLSVSDSVLKTELQLLGITCLFIAAKVEEVYPSKVSEFAYVTDGACRVDQILQMELHVLHKLDWCISTMTAHGWLSLLLQLCADRAAAEPCTQSGTALFAPRHPVHEYLQVARLLDLATLDEGSLAFSYSVLAASAIYLTCYKDHVLRTSGLKLVDIAGCVDWMRFFDAVLRTDVEHPVRCATALPPGAPAHEAYLLQTHVVDLSLLDAGQARIEEQKRRVQQMCVSSSLMTP